MCEVELKTIEPVQDSWSSRPVLDTIPPHLKMLFAGIVCNPPLMSRPVARKEGLRQRAHSTHRPTDSWLAQPGRARGRGGERNDRRWNCMEDSPHSSRNTDIETPEVRWIALIALNAPLRVHAILWCYEQGDTFLYECFVERTVAEIDSNRMPLEGPGQPSPWSCCWVCHGQQEIKLFQIRNINIVS